MNAIAEISSTISSLAKGAASSVVGVGNQWGVGSGVVVAKGKVLTNAHNLRGRGEIIVTFADGRTATATAAGVDVDGDLAVLDVETGDAPTVTWSDADGLDIGSPVFAVSNPGGRGLRVTFGTVSGTQRAFRGPRGTRIAGSVEHTAPLLPGSSGGPILDAAGAFLGINTNRLGEGFYLAIPANGSLRGRVEALAKGETPSRPRLGVGLAPAEVAQRLRAAVGLPEATGLLVRQVEQDGPAARAGIREGDLITAAAGKPTPDPDALHAALMSADGALELTVLRGTEQRTVSVTL